MKCFYHSETDAVGICKNCQRALCRACAGDGQNSLACPNRCEDAVAQVDKLIATNIRVTTTKGSVVFLMPVFFLLAGIGFAYVAWQQNEPGFYFMSLFALLFGVTRLVTIARYRKLIS